MSDNVILSVVIVICITVIIVAILYFRNDSLYHMHNSPGFNELRRIQQQSNDLYKMIVQLQNRLDLLDGLKDETENDSCL